MGKTFVNVKWRNLGIFEEFFLLRRTNILPGLDLKFNRLRCWVFTDSMMQNVFGYTKVTQKYRVLSHQNGLKYELDGQIDSGFKMHNLYQRYLLL